MNTRSKPRFVTAVIVLSLAVVGLVGWFVLFTHDPSKVSAARGVVLQDMKADSSGDLDLVPSSGTLVSVTWMGQTTWHLELAGASTCMRRVLLRTDANGKWHVPEWKGPDGSYVGRPFSGVYKAGYAEVPSGHLDGHMRPGEEDVKILRRSSDALVSEDRFREYSWGCQTETLGEETSQRPAERTSPGGPGDGSSAVRWP